MLTAASNRLTSVPGELGHLPCLAVLNLCDNLLPHLPVSLTKLKVGIVSIFLLLIARSPLMSFSPSPASFLSFGQYFELTRFYLPFSLTPLFIQTQLRALWLSENQNKPKVQLQSEVHPSTGQRVLTCFMLPQQPRPHHPGNVVMSSWYTKFLNFGLCRKVPH